MSNLQDLINLAKADGGKFFVIDESGEPKLVIMSVEDYQRLLLGKLQRQVADVEKINREITRAQLEEEKITAAQRLGAQKLAPAPAPVFRPPVQYPEAPRPAAVPRVDLREEVIDPSFDFEGPKMDIDDL